MCGSGRVGVDEDECCDGRQESGKDGGQVWRARDEGRMGGSRCPCERHDEAIHVQLALKAGSVHVGLVRNRRVLAPGNQVTAFSPLKHRSRNSFLRHDFDYSNTFLV